MALTVFRCADVYIFNSGIWGNDEDFMDHPNNRRDIIKAISDAVMIGVCKTTTKGKNQDGSRKDYEVEFCRIAD